MYKVLTPCNHTCACSFRRCFRVQVEGDPCNPNGCNSTIIPRTNFSISLEPSPIAQNAPLQTKFWSPGKIRNPPRDYQNNRRCQYHLTCPQGQIMFFGFETGNFDIEPMSLGSCLDFVRVEDLSSGSFQLCGSQTQRSWTRASPLRVEFRSNTRERFPGFQIDAICVQPEFGNQPGCNVPMSDVNGNSSNNAMSTTDDNRRKRSLSIVSHSYTVYVCI